MVLMKAKASIAFTSAVYQSGASLGRNVGLGGGPRAAPGYEYAKKHQKHRDEQVDAGFFAENQHSPPSTLRSRATFCPSFRREPSRSSDEKEQAIVKSFFRPKLAATR
jgi:hypothetical protein